MKDQRLEFKTESPLLLALFASLPETCVVEQAQPRQRNQPLEETAKVQRLLDALATDPHTVRTQLLRHQGPRAAMEPEEQHQAMLRLRVDLLARMDPSTAHERQEYRRPAEVATARAVAVAQLAKPAAGPACQDCGRTTEEVLENSMAALAKGAHWLPADVVHGHPCRPWALLQSEAQGSAAPSGMEELG